MASQLEDRYDERITGNCFGRRPGVRAKEHDRHHFFQHRGYASASDLHSALEGIVNAAAVTSSVRALPCWGFFALAALVAPPVFASPQVSGATSTPSCEQQSDRQCESDNNGGDVTNPTSSLELRLEDRIISRPTTRTRKRKLELRLSTKVVLPSGWKLHLLGQLPAESVTTSHFGPPTTIQNSGLSDIFFQAALFHPIDDRWAFGFGARLIAPSLSAGVGQNGWEIMPLAGVRAMLPELSAGSYFAPFARYAVGLAGDLSGRKVSELQIAPTLNIQMQERWFVTFYPNNDIRINYGGSVAGETGRLFLPLDMAIGRLVSDIAVVTLEASVPIIKDYPVYDFKTELRVMVKF